MNTKFHAKKICIMLSVIVIAAGVVWYGSFVYVRKTAEAAAALETDYTEKTTQSEKDRALKSFMDSNAESIKLLSSVIIEKGGTVPFIELIENLGRGGGLGINIDTVGINSDSSHPDTYEYLKLNFTTQGTWKNTYAFLAMIEAMPRKLKINRVATNELTFTATKDGKKESVWKTSFEIEVLKQKE